MTFREINKTYIEPIAQWTMIAGILALCQPWSAFLHEWSVAIMLLGFVGFIVSIHIAPPAPEAIDHDDTGPVSIHRAVKGHDHG